jgi:hypothetical protein
LAGEESELKGVSGVRIEKTDATLARSLTKSN